MAAAKKASITTHALSRRTVPICGLLSSTRFQREMALLRKAVPPQPFDSSMISSENRHRSSLATNARRSCSIRPSFERHQPVRWMNGPKVKQPVKLKSVFLIDGLHGTAPLAAEFVQHFFRRRAARFEDALQRFEVAALVTAGMIDAVAPPQARMRQLQ